MTIKEIRESGLLEYYVLGLLTEQETQKVEGYLSQYPELKADYIEIQNAMEVYASSQGIAAKADLKDNIISKVKSEGTKPTHTAKSSGTSLLSKSILFLLAAATVGALWYASQKSKAYHALQTKYDIETMACDSLQKVHTHQLDLFKSLNNKNNRILNMTPTAGYQETNLLFHINEVTKQNFIQIRNLPAIANNQAFQLWSLKEGEDPIPLTIFKAGKEFVVPVDFEDGTGTYAITIENENGAEVPTLSRLIVTVGV